MMSSRLATLSLIFLLTFSGAAQTTLPVTGWYDGIANGDSVTHGTGFVGAGPLHTNWLINGQPARWASHMVTLPGGSEACWHGATTYPNSLIPFAGNLHMFIGNGQISSDPAPGDDANYTRDGLVQDPISVITRYADGRYDQQTYALWLPNTGITVPDPADPKTQYMSGTGPFATTMLGPNRLDANGISRPTAYMFFGADRFDVDQGKGAHMFGVATSPVVVDAGSSLNHVTFSFSKWLDLNSPNYTGLKSAGVQVDRYNPTTGQTLAPVFTPLFARTGGTDTTAGLWFSRFANTTGYFIDNYFYLFIGLGGNSERGAISIRIPSDPSHPAGLGRNPDGSIKVQLWYVENGVAAYRTIDSKQPIRFSSDSGGGANPPVPMSAALLKDTNGSYVNMPNGIFQYPLTGTPQSYWFTSNQPFSNTPIRVHRIAYNASNPSNPLTITTPYQIDYGNYTGCNNGACTVPSRYKNRANPTVIYPLNASAGTAMGFMEVSLASCPDYYADSGPLPFTVSGLWLY
jgi:hypothetical protein